MEGRISELEDRNFEIMQLGENKEKGMKKNEESLHDPWESIKCTNIKIISISEGEEREKVVKSLFKLIAEKFSNFGKTWASNSWSW